MRSFTSMILPKTMMQSAMIHTHIKIKKDGLSREGERVGQGEPFRSFYNVGITKVKCGVVGVFYFHQPNE